MTLAVVGALPEEVHAVASRLRDPNTSVVDGVRIRSGRLAGHPVVTCVTGDGPARARRSTSALYGHLGPVPTVFVGVCGSLTDGLKAGELVRPAVVVDSRTGSTIAPTAVESGVFDPDTTTAAVFLTHSALVTDSTDRAPLMRLAEEHGPGLPAVVDLESAHFASVAEERGAPWTLVRGVSDTPDDGLPDFLVDTLDAHGSVDRWSVAAGLAVRPWLLPDLLRLRARVVECSARIADRIEAGLGNRTP